MHVLMTLGLILLMAMHALPTHAATPTVEIGVPRGDIRAGPGASHAIIGEVQRGEQFPTLGKQGEWVLIRLVDGREGWIHARLVATSRGESVTPAPPGRTTPALAPGMFYTQSWAVIIGINDYHVWPKLNYAVNDARSVRDQLLRMGFEPRRIFELYDQQATKENILRIVADELPRLTGANDRVLFFFAGHGQTEELPGGIKRGYLIPVDGDLEHLYARSIPMNVVADISQRIPAKHMLFVMDACYSGLALARSAPASPTVPGYLDKVTGTRARQIITAGGAGEQVFEQEGHGLFTRRFLDGLGGEADADGDGVITGLELGSYLRRRVSDEAANKQTPVFGTMEGEGEFVFVIPPRQDSTPGELRVQAPPVEPRTGKPTPPRPQEAKLQAVVSQPTLVQYHLLITHVDFATFASYLDRPTTANAGEEIMPRLESRLDRLEFPAAAVIPGRQVQMLTDPAYGSTGAVHVVEAPMAKGKSWSTLVWEGHPGARVAFEVKSEMQAWPDVRAVAANPRGVLRRLSIGGPGFFGGGAREVAEASYDFLANAADRGTFGRWVEQHAQPLNGLSIVVARGRGGSLSSDRVYAMMTLPQEPRTFKLVIGWDQPDRFRDRPLPRR